MNWKNVRSLIQVERKSSRLIRGRKLTKYRESGFLAYWPYWAGLALGITVGLLAGIIFNYASAVDPEISALFQQGALNIFLSLPTLVLVYSLVFTMMQQIQRSGIKASSQVTYWLPVTWQEQTLASILASLLGFPLASVVFITSAITILSVFIGQFLLAVMASLAVFAVAFMASTITEILRMLQVRFLGAVYKSSGRAAVWVRFIGSLLFFLVFYIIYFYVTSGGAVTFIQTIASAQTTAWFVPFVWLGMTLYFFTNGLLLHCLIFLSLSLLVISGLFFLAILLNRRFGVYEPPAITISRGTYTPKTGFLGKLGFSTAEASLIRKDLRAFTRRRELMTIFIAPIVVILVPLMQSFGQTNAAFPSSASVMMLAMFFLFPASILAMSLGSFMIGEEGQAVWRIYASPISANTLVKSKYFFIIFFSIIVLAVTGTFGFIIYHPTLRAAIVAYCETIFLIFTLGAISLSNGIKGADFTEVPRHRMIRLSWSLINLVACLLAGTAIMAPFLPYVLSLVLSEIMPDLTEIVFLDPLLAVAVSAIITIALTVIFYSIALKNARELLAKVEM